MNSDDASWTAQVLQATIQCLAYTFFGMQATLEEEEEEEDQEEGESDMKNDSKARESELAAEKSPSTRRGKRRAEGCFFLDLPYSIIKGMNLTLTEALAFWRTSAFSFLWPPFFP